ncbi:phage tail sheath family protein (plasmid) [Burkholderia sp. MS455]|uniref:phage tail sheath family protein n=1 Tax=Burkholderia sp. MS455 TaxID=2811788 RepID=UPI00195BA02F|nr:phage tail sheath C-terminal domain-containing protein [Burkholderia sp. MS455]QRR07656.1 phage tail sheath family protein [Burkholderia sp. MS455]QRR11838.1 phage tail sheath family protein [Burkholderia sp. MS455]
MGEAGVIEQAWLEPGVRLTQATMAADGWSDELPSAVPVFIGWSSVPHNDSDAACWSSVASWEQLPAEAKVWPPVLCDTVQHYFDNGGGPCFVLTAQPPGDLSTATEFANWWQTLVQEVSGRVLSEPTITLAAVPQLVTQVEWMGISAEAQLQGAVSVESILIAAWRVLLSACASRPDLFFVLDAPSQPATARACVELLRGDQALGALGQHAALYGPHLVTDYRQSAQADVSVVEVDGFRVVPPCGAVLGVYVRTDAASGVWKAPANEALAHVVKPQVRETLTSGWFDVSKVTINLIRSFAGRGTRVWGCRTLDGRAGSPFRYVQVRRAVTWIETNLRQICRFAVFEPNHEITWFQLRGLCSAWLRRLWLDGGLAGADEAHAYSVQVGRNESMTAVDIEAGRLIVTIGVALLHAAEFIEVKLVLQAGETQAGAADQAGSEQA